MNVGVTISLRRFMVGFKLDETHLPIYKEFPAGFTKTTKRQIQVDTIRQLTVSPFPFVSFDISWKIDEDHLPMHEVDAFSQYFEEDVHPYEGEII